MLEKLWLGFLVSALVVLLSVRPAHAGYLFGDTCFKTYNEAVYTKFEHEDAQVLVVGKNQDVYYLHRLVYDTPTQTWSRKIWQMNLGGTYTLIGSWPLAVATESFPVCETDSDIYAWRNVEVSSLVFYGLLVVMFFFGVRMGFAI